MKTITRTMITSAIAVALTGAAHAVLVNLGPGSFTPAAATIEFDEFVVGTVNPTYTLSAGSLGNVTVSFGGHFVGQVAGGSPATLTDTTPTPFVPLSLDPAAPVTRTVNDGAPGATSPVLSGTPTFNGPISVLFSTPVAAVGLKGGFFDAVGGTTIQAYDAFGVSLGNITNTSTGFEFYGLADSTGANVISGISFFITGNEPAGFQIDNLTFGAREVITGVPDGGMTAVMLFGSVGLLGLGRRLGRK